MPENQKRMAPQVGSWCGPTDFNGWKLPEHHEGMRDGISLDSLSLELLLRSGRSWGNGFSKRRFPPRRRPCKARSEECRAAPASAACVPALV